MISFRRIHGRIIPIKMKDSTVQRVKGAAQIAGGIAAAAGVAYVGARFALKGKILGAKSYAASTRGLNIVNEALQTKRLGQAADAFKKSKALLDAGEVLGKAAPVIGASIAGAGAYKVFQGKKAEHKERAAWAAGATTAAAYAIARKVSLKVAFPFIKG